MRPNDRDYYQKREADERAAAEQADPNARRAHLEMADLYAARLQGDEADRTAPAS